MKKKQITSKLQLQKTTIVSFNKLTNIVGGTMQNTDTRIVSVRDYTCISFLECVTNDDKYTCLSCTGTECTRPTNTGTKYSDFCGNNPDTRMECLDSRAC